MFVFYEGSCFREMWMVENILPFFTYGDTRGMENNVYILVYE